MSEVSRTARRLAAILAADVAGYSRLMGADEEGTLVTPKGWTMLAASAMRLCPSRQAAN
jgi:hypothetical protein